MIAVRTLWLSEKDVAALLDVKEALPLVEGAFASLARGEAQMPPKVYLTFEKFQGDLRAMPAFLPKAGMSQLEPYAGIKMVNSHPKNPEKDLPTVAAILALHDPKTGMPLALMAAGHLTDVRTGAAGAVAAKYLARPHSSVLGLVGCGRQAATQWRALREIFSFREVRVSGKNLKEAEDFCAKIGVLPQTKFVACATVQEACQADIVVTTTPSRAPVVKREWIKPGTHINAIGADAPGKQELEGALLKNARVVVDLAEQAFHSGEVNVPLAKKELAPEDILGNLGDLILGNFRGRQSDADITIFDSTGLAVQDVSVGAWVYEKARAVNRGQWLELF